MKKLISIILALVCVASLVACSNTKNTNSESPEPNTSTEQIKQDDTKIYGRIDAVDGEVFTISIMEDVGDNPLCPIDPNGESDTNQSDNGNNIDNPNKEETNGNIAQPGPHDIKSIFLDYTGDIKKITIKKDTKVLYPNDTELQFSDLAVGCVIQINLDKPNGKIDNIRIIG